MTVIELIRISEVQQKAKIDLSNTISKSCTSQMDHGKEPINQSERSLPG